MAAIESVDSRVPPGSRRSCGSSTADRAGDAGSGPQPQEESQPHTGRHVSAILITGRELGMHVVGCYLDFDLLQNLYRLLFYLRIPVP